MKVCGESEICISSLLPENADTAGTGTSHGKQLICRLSKSLPFTIPTDANLSSALLCGCCYTYKRHWLTLSGALATCSDFTTNAVDFPLLSSYDCPKTQQIKPKFSAALTQTRPSTFFLKGAEEPDQSEFYLPSASFISLLRLYWKIHSHMTLFNSFLNLKIIFKKMHRSESK